LAVYMGAAGLSRLSAELLAGGLAPETPILIVSNASLNTQRRLTTTLGELASGAPSDPIPTPALAIIGSVARKPMVNKLGGALAGLTVLVTRPAEDSLPMCELLRSEGAEPLPFPTIAIAPAADVKGWGKFLALRQPPDWCVFTSASGVRHFFAGLWQRGLDVRALAKSQIAVIGPGTAAALAQYGLRPNLRPAVATVKALAVELHRRVALKDCLLLRVRGDLSDQTIEKMARQAGAGLLPLTVYKTETAVWDDHQKRLLAEAEVDWLTFASGSAVVGFVKILGEEKAREVLAKCQVASIGHTTTAALRGIGAQVTVQAKRHTIKGMVKAMAAAHNQRLKTNG